MEQKVKLEEMLKQERIKIKTLESQIYQFREELLVVKNERNLSNTKLKTQKNDINRSNQELVIVNQAKNILENNVKGQDRLVVDKTIECKQLIEENVKLKEKLDNALLELEAAKKKKDTENNNELQCSLCDADFLQSVELKHHIRSNHYRDQVGQTRTLNKIVSTQTEENIETIEYPCFYCDYVIASFEDLIEHKGNCSVSEMYQDKCDLCDAKFAYRSDLIHHYKTNHPEISIVWCGFCQAGFEAIEELQCHIRFEHRNYLPG